MSIPIREVKINYGSVSHNYRSLSGKDAISDFVLQSFMKCSTDHEEMFTAKEILARLIERLYHNQTINSAELIEIVMGFADADIEITDLGQTDLDPTSQSPG